MMTRIFSIFAVMMLLSTPVMACDETDGGIVAPSTETPAPSTGSGE